MPQRTRKDMACVNTECSKKSECRFFIHPERLHRESDSVSMIESTCDWMEKSDKEDSIASHNKRIKKSIDTMTKKNRWKKGLSEVDL